MARHYSHTFPATGPLNYAEAREHGGMCSLCYCADWIVEELELLLAENELLRKAVADSLPPL